MSQDNVDVVRRFADAFAHRGVDGMAEFWDPDVTHRAIEGAIDDVGEMHGPAALRRYFADWGDMFDDLAVVLEEVRDVGDGQVLTVLRMTGRAKISGAETELRYAVVYTIRDGKIVRGREYQDSELALEAIRLREPEAS